MLNHDIDHASQLATVHRAFFGNVRKQLLPAGCELYKFTHYPLFNPDGSVTPWWSSVQPVAQGDPGLEQTLARAKSLGVKSATFVQARSAVTRQWNRMTGLLRVQLLMPVFCLVGRCASQRFDEAPEFANVVFIGGAWQLYIPNLTRREVSLCQ